MMRNEILRIVLVLGLSLLFVTASFVSALNANPLQNSTSAKSGGTLQTSISASWTEMQKLLASDGETNDMFGFDVSLSGDTALVGKLGDDGYKGSAYIFVRTGNNWVLKQQLLALDGGIGDWFGVAVSIDGDTALIGAQWDNDNGYQAGSAYVFTRSGSNWTQQAKLLASDGEVGDHFGQSVSLNGDTALVGAYYDDDNGIDSGSVYVFTRTGTTWTQQTKLLASDGATGDTFGNRVSVAGDTAFIGAPENDDNGDSSGSVYVFTRTGTTWTEQQKLLAADSTAGDKFGFSVSVDGDTALIGAFVNDAKGSAYVFTRTGAAWIQQAKFFASDGAASDNFGVAVSLDGNTALIGAHGDDGNGVDSGSAYVFTRTGTTWTEQAKLLASDGEAGDWFGVSVSLSGHTAVIGVPLDDDSGDNSGSMYVFIKKSDNQQPGSIVAWGWNDNGQCNIPSPNIGFIAVSAGGYFSLGLKADGSIVAWGYNGYGECNVPSPNTGFTAISAGWDHCLGLKSDGSIVAWGHNAFGVCNVPLPNSGFTAVAAGEQHSLGLKADGSIVVWGSNNNGQCDLPSPNSGFTAISAGALNSLGLKVDGSIVAWGTNWYGQCNVPSPNTGFTAISAGAWHGLGLKSDGSIVAWGYNNGGACEVPSPNSGYTAISAGGFHSMGLKADGSIVAWGENSAGQCDVPSPNTGFTAVAAGYGHSLSLKVPPSIVYIDDDFDSSNPGWGYDHFDVIQDGINAVAEHGTVYVYSGIYYESLIAFKNNIYLIGEDKNTTIVDIQGAEGGFAISNVNNVRISGFKLINTWGSCIIPAWSTNIIIEDCITSSNGGYYGINVKYDCSNVIVRNCESYGNQYGIELEHSGTGVEVYNNKIHSNSVIGLRSFMTGAVIYHNNIYDNPQNAQDEGSNQWDNGYASGGNYWCDYIGTDIYNGPNQDIPGSDGIGDTPYLISGGNNQDNYPFMNPNDWLPPIQFCPPDLIYHLNETAGTNVADSSGNNNDGTAQNMGVNPLWIPGKLNNCLQFDGVDDYVESNDAIVGDYDYNEPFSVECWVNGNVHKQYAGIVSKMQYDSGIGWYLGTLSTGSIVFLADHDNANNRIHIWSNTTLSDYVWHHIVVTLDGSSTASGLHMYIDGVEVDFTIYLDGLTGSIHTNELFKIGVTRGSGIYFSGKIDEVVLYPCTLNSSQVAYRYNNGYGLEYYIEQPDQPPVADADGPYICELGETIIFDGSGSYDPDGDIVSYQWTFGEGDIGYGVNPTHKYDNYGTYTVTLTVTDDDGLTDTDATYAFVNKVNPPTIILQYPVGGETLKDTITVKWWALDTEDGYNLPISIYYKNEISSAWSSFSDNPYSNNGECAWDTTALPDGTYKLSVQAQDSDGNIVADSSDWFQIKNHEEPPINNPPRKPDTPQGTANGKIHANYIYVSMTHDPEGDMVYYLWDWGDGNNSGWLGPYTSGVTSQTTNNWTIKGNYAIKVKAKDIHGAESAWSDPLPVTMPYRFNPLQQFFEWLFERFPNVFPILKQLLGY